MLRNFHTNSYKNVITDKMLRNFHANSYKRHKLTKC